MNSEREKREREIQRLMQGSGPNPEAEVQFREELKKTASAIFEQETRKIQKKERPKRSIDPATIGVWLIVLGVAGFVFDVPQFGAMAVVAGIAAILWGTVLKPTGKPPRRTATSRGSSRRRPF